VVQGTVTICVNGITENGLLFNGEIIKHAVDKVKRIISAFRNDELPTLSVTLYNLLAVI
jgi:hypothetical protein